MNNSFLLLSKVVYVHAVQYSESWGIPDIPKRTSVTKGEKLLYMKNKSVLFKLFLKYSLYL